MTTGVKCENVEQYAMNRFNSLIIFSKFAVAE